MTCVPLEFNRQYYGMDFQLLQTGVNGLTYIV
jgi:hypothetical protein